jgi:hypothetical protein
MRPWDILARWSAPGFDLTPLFMVAVLVLVCVAMVDFSRSFAGAEHGLLLYERACPLNHAS